MNGQKSQFYIHSSIMRARLVQWAEYCKENGYPNEARNAVNCIRFLRVCERDYEQELRHMESFGLITESTHIKGWNDAEKQPS